MKKTLDQILQEQKSRTKLSLLICLSLLIAAIVLVLAKQIMGWVFLAMGIIIGTTLWLRLRRNRQELGRLGSPEQARARLGSPDTVYYACFGLTLGRDFALQEQPALRVWLLDEMEKFEVGLAGDVQKVLFLTDRNGQRHALAESRKGDDHQADFDRAYRQIRDLFAERDRKN